MARLSFREKRRSVRQAPPRPHLREKPNRWTACSQRVLLSPKYQRAMLVSGAGITRRLSIMQARNVMTYVDTNTCRKISQVLGNVARSIASNCITQIDVISATHSRAHEARINCACANDSFCTMAAVQLPRQSETVSRTTNSSPGRRPPRARTMNTQVWPMHAKARWERRQKRGLSASIARTATLDLEQIEHA
jgi:hypothetical protein